MNPLLDYYRRNNGPTVQLGEHVAVRGAWVRSDLMSAIGRTSAFGPPLKANRMPGDLREAARAHQPVIAPASSEAPAPSASVDPGGEVSAMVVVPTGGDREMLAKTLGNVAVCIGSTPVVIAGKFSGGFHADTYESAVVEGLTRAFEMQADAVVVLHDDCRLTVGAAPRLLEALRRGAGLVIPVSNEAGAYSAPFAGDRGRSPARRLPGGADVHTVAAALGKISPCYPSAPWADGGCFAISKEAWAATGSFDGDLSDLAAACLASGHRAVVADNAYVWHEGRNTRQRIVPPRCGSLMPLSEWCRNAVEQYEPPGLPVHLMAVDLGTWGGSYCTMRLVEELCALGFRAQVGRIREETHRERFPFGTVHHLAENTLGEDFVARAGWARGVVVATHWSTGRLVRRIKASVPGVVLAAFWQDLEHRFIDPKTGRASFPKDQAREYVTIQNRIYNAPWVWQEGAAEFGLCSESGNEASFTEWIPVGIDTQRFFPDPAREPNDKVRILAMWRPQTKRRGGDRLVRLYERLHRWFGERISLEVYGWDGIGLGFVRSHGFLTQREVAELLRGVDIFVETSDFQGFGLTGAEAMACGVPLVSTDTKGVHAYASPEGARIEKRDGAEHDEGDLQQLVCDLIEDPDERRLLGAAGCSQIQGIAWQVVARSWARYLARLWLEQGEGFEEFCHEILRRTA